MDRPCSLTLFLLGVTVVIFGLLPATGDASIFYSVHTLPVPRYRSYFDSVGEQSIGQGRFETSVIIQEDILVRKRCECIPRYRCRSPRNIINLKTRDCHHHEKVCCEF
ncbi:uncharacterized protein LOC120415221 [Culex pipiens pallens]|uniref:uncharacterized protein LOC120415221 n=1 Tax=Culex pipiens pallens TaxID=42434 RepID=UPI001954AC2C|nr:uncharacterized protein LOC120415221 [Culex pipiens pallens]